MLPYMSLIALSFIVFTATSYTVLIFIEYTRNSDAFVKRRPLWIGVAAIGSGYFAIHLIGILTFTTEHRFLPNWWMLALSGVVSCLIAASAFQLFKRNLHKGRKLIGSLSLIVVLAETVHIVSVLSILNARPASLAIGYYASFIAAMLVLCYFGFRFIFSDSNENANETNRVRKAIGMGLLLALVHYALAAFFYASAWLPSIAAEGVWAIDIAIVISVVTTVVLVTSANLIYMDVQAVRKETALLARVKESELRFRTLAYTDHLTGMPNRHWFFRQIRSLLEKKNAAVETVGVVLFDFDDFKSINELIGHDKADLFLKKIIKRVESVLPDSVQLARFGGDEFVFMVPDAKEPELEKICQRILSKVREPIQIGERHVRSGISIGVSTQTIDKANEDELIKQADLALFMAKSRGKESYEFFSSKLLDSSSRKQEIGAALQQALLNGEFSVHYQPQVELVNGQIIGFEALLRWNSALGAVSPAEFIPVAEESGAIHAIGEWVLREACEQLKVWRKTNRPDVHISVNVSPSQFRDSEFAKKVALILKETDIPANCVEIEITESVMLDTDSANELLQELKSIGVKLAIDDFGTGYSSLNAVKNMQIDTLKIDKSLVDEVLDNERSMAILATIIELGKNLGTHIVVEGLETIEQVDLMRKYGVIGQGYYFSRPLPADKATKVWDAHVANPAASFRTSVFY